MDHVCVVLGGAWSCGGRQSSVSRIIYKYFAGYTAGSCMIVLYRRTTIMVTLVLMHTRHAHSSVHSPFPRQTALVSALISKEGVDNDVTVRD